jgi:hypothetical protein
MGTPDERSISKCMYDWECYFMCLSDVGDGEGLKCRMSKRLRRGTDD